VARTTAGVFKPRAGGNPHPSRFARRTRSAQARKEKAKAFDLGDATFHEGNETLIRERSPDCDVMRMLLD
jgi:hypothetical protein